MEILVLGTKIETKDIVEIYEVERDKRIFLNREAGFTIRFIDESEKTFSESIPYETYPRHIADLKTKWSVLQDEVTAQWNQDKHQLPEFNL